MSDPNERQEALEKFQAFAAKQQQQHPEEGLKRACHICGGKGFTRATRDGYDYIVKCSCRASEERRKVLKDSGIPYKFWNCTLQEKGDHARERFKMWGEPLARKSQEMALDACRNLFDVYLDKFKRYQDVEDLYGLILYGDCGRGKTRLAASLLVDLVYAGMKSVRFVEYNELFKQIRFSYGGAELTYEQIFNRMINVNVLVIDDFGMEVSGDHIWVLDNIGYIINERYVTNRPTILTTNFWKPLGDASNPRAEGIENRYELPSWELKRRAEKDKEAVDEEIMGERVSYRLRSRLSEMCLQLKVEGGDYRKRISRNREMLLQKKQRERSRKS